jgi:hypothetical protein
VAPRLLLRLLAAYGLALAVACAALFFWLRLEPGEAAVGPTLHSTWLKGKRTGRAVVAAGEPAPTLDCPQGCTHAVDVVVAEGPVLAFADLALAMSLVPGRDGLVARLGDRAAWLTPDDLLAVGAATGHSPFGEANVALGVGPIERAMEALAADLGVNVATLRRDATFRRFVTRRGEGDRRAKHGEPVPDAELTPQRMRRAVVEAGRYLARQQRPDGGFHYWIDGITGEKRRGYSFPRHGGTASFLAEAAAFTGDVDLKNAAINSARFIYQRGTARCGGHPCVGWGDRVDLGSTAMAVVTYAQLVRHGLDAKWAEAIPPLTAFLRSMQREDGEFMHYYDRKAGRAIDRQTQYYTGETTLALVLAYEVTKDPADLEAAKKALAYAVGPRWDFFGSRYFFGNEHWTCQALQVLWAHAPNPDALDFCVRYQWFSRLMQREHGGYNLHPLHLTRVSDTGSRTESAGATLVTARAAGLDAATLAPIEGQIRAAAGFLIGFQFMPGPAHLLYDPGAMRGGFPGSAVDMAVRIDLAQHAGAGILRYLEYLEGRGR